MRFHRKTIPVLACAVAMFAHVGCADKVVETVESKPKSLGERLSEGGGYVQDADGNWVPKSDKRSSFDSQRDSPFFSRKIKKDEYKTGDYTKKSWWGGKEDYGTDSYEGNTDGSRFQKKARQEGQVSRNDGQDAGLSQSYGTNTLDRQGAREGQYSAVGRPNSAYVEADRNSYPSPSVIGWQEQRNMSVDDSRGILGR